MVFKFPHPFIISPALLVLQDIVHSSKPLELLLLLRILIRVENHSQLLVLVLDLFCGGIPGYVHQLVEGAIDLVHQLKKSNLLLLPRNIIISRVPGKEGRQAGDDGNKPAQHGGGGGPVTLKVNINQYFIYNIFMLCPERMLKVSRIYNTRLSNLKVR